MTPKVFRPTCYAQLSRFQPAPAQPKRRLSAVNALFSLALAVALIVAAWPAAGVVISGDFPGAARCYGWQEDSAAVAALLDLHNVIAH
jgi:hypothetical protein